MGCGGGSKGARTNTERSKYRDLGAGKAFLSKLEIKGINQVQTKELAKQTRVFYTENKICRGSF
jgi:hypothetical protein